MDSAIKKSPEINEYRVDPNKEPTRAEVFKQKLELAKQANELFPTKPEPERNVSFTKALQ